MCRPVFFFCHAGSFFFFLFSIPEQSIARSFMREIIPHISVSSHFPYSAFFLQTSCWIRLRLFFCILCCVLFFFFLSFFAGAVPFFETVLSVFPGLLVLGVMAPQAEGLLARAPVSAGSALSKGRCQRRSKTKNKKKGRKELKSKQSKPK